MWDAGGGVKGLLLHPECFLARAPEELLPLPLHSSALGQRGLGNLKPAASGVCTGPVGGLALVVDWFAEDQTLGNCNKDIRAGGPPAPQVRAVEAALGIAQHHTAAREPFPGS